MAALAGAHPALPLRVRQILDIGNGVGGYALLRCHHKPRPCRQGEPAVVGRSQFGGNAGLQHGGVDRCQEIEIGILAQAGDIDGEDHIRRARLALGFQALRQSFGCIDHICVDAGLGTEGIEERLKQELLTMRIDIEFRRTHARGEAGRPHDKSDKSRRDTAHGRPQRLA